MTSLAMFDWISSAGLTVGRAPKRLFRVALVLATGLGLQALADKVVLNPVADTSLFEYVPTNNMGKTVDLPIGTIEKGSRSRLLLRFDVAGALPPAATVTAASLTLTVVSAPDVGAVNSNFQLHRMLVSWTEGTKNGQVGQPASPGEPTWNARVHPATLWSQPGAAAPVDFSPVISGSELFLRPAIYTYPSNTNLVADVQFWLQNPSNNFGWIVISDQEAAASAARRVDSRENHVHPPALSIEFTAPPTPQLDSITLAQGRVQIRFPLLAGKVYDLQYTPSIGMGTWSNLTQLGPSAFPLTAIVEDSITNAPFRFYRLESSP